MDYKLQKINGTNSSLEYEALSRSIIKKLNTTCKKVEVIILNNFPVAVSSESTIDFIILLHIPKLPSSFYRIEKEKERVYVKNQLIAVSLLKNFEDASIVKDSFGIKIDGERNDFDDQANDLKWSLTNYLANSCGLQRNKITVHPLFWLKSDKVSLTSDHIIVNENLLYDEIESVISNNYYFKYSGYSDWSNSDVDFEIKIKQIFEQASKDSETGYITRKKVERFHSRFDPASQKAYDSIGSKLVEVKGKAGTGKSSDLLKWMLNSSLENKASVFLTYNRLLVFDAAKQIQSFHNGLSEEKRAKRKPTTTNTLHSFFHNVAKKLGVLMLLSEDRILELSNLLDERWQVIEVFLDTIRKKEPRISLAKLKMYVQNDEGLDEGTKREAINFIKFIEVEKFLNNKLIISKSFEEYRTEKLNRLGKLESSNVFLKDYTKVLERILQATINLDNFIEDLNIQDKFDLLYGVMKLDRSILEKNGSGKIDLEALKRRYQNTLNHLAHRRIVYVDEAQDCHPHERDILYNIFGSDKVVIANGDKEQLIRFSELCDWKISRNKKIEGHTYTKKKRSYRMKPAVAALANHIAKYYNIDLEIESIETEDHGLIILDYGLDSESQIKVIKELSRIGERQGCTSYDSLLMLTTAENISIGTDEEVSVSVNEFGNIIKSKNNIRAEWDLLKEASAEDTDFKFWNATGNVDKKKLGVPGALSVRSIYYQSCRGLEAWSVMCFRLDEFFDQKFNDDEAENYLLNDLFDQLTPTLRRNKYAATWILMAVTRAMENCFINLSDSSSPFSKCIKEFEEEYPNFVRYTKTYA